MEKKPDHLVILSESETEIFTRVLGEPAKGKPATPKTQHTQFKKKKKRVLRPGEDTEFFF